MHANLPAELKEVILTLNNGPAWTRARWAYDLYNSSVFETASNEWEKPPGLGICALDQLYQLCDHIANWHALGDRNVVVSHLCILAVHHLGMHCQEQALVCCMVCAAVLPCADWGLLVQLLHTRSLAGMSMGFNLFLTACYMIFSLQHISIPKAMDDLLVGKAIHDQAHAGASRKPTPAPCKRQVPIKQWGQGGSLSKAWCFT